jgi:hypothetical protein
VTVNRPATVVTAFRHPRNGVFLAVATWHQPLAEWMRESLDVSLDFDRRALGLPAGPLRAEDILSGEVLDPHRPIPLPRPREGRLLWVRGARRDAARPARR